VRRERGGELVGIERHRVGLSLQRAARSTYLPPPTSQQPMSQPPGAGVQLGGGQQGNGQGGQSTGSQSQQQQQGAGPCGAAGAGAAVWKAKPAKNGRRADSNVFMVSVTPVGGRRPDVRGAAPACRNLAIAVSALAPAS
jgi:hypothetical protein